MMVNRQIGASSFPAAYAAHILLGGSDYTVSHETASLPVAEFVNAVWPCVAEEARTTTFVPTVQEPGRRAWASAYDNYRLRPPLLRDVSPYMYTMWFTLEARGRDGAGRDGVRWELDPAHPNYATKVRRPTTSLTHCSALRTDAVAHQRARPVRRWYGSARCPCYRRSGTRHHRAPSRTRPWAQHTTRTPRT